MTFKTLKNNTEIRIKDILSFYISTIIEDQFVKNYPDIRFNLSYLEDKHLLTLSHKNSCFTDGVSIWITNDSNILEDIAYLYNHVEFLATEK